MKDLPYNPTQTYLMYCCEKHMFAQVEYLIIKVSGF